MIVAADVDHAVNQKKRIAVRQQPKNFCNIRDTRVSSPIIYPFDLAAALVQPIPPSTPKTIWLSECRRMRFHNFGTV